MGMTDTTRTDEESPHEVTPVRVRLPGFIADKDVGFGEAIKRVTYAFGIKPCGGCEQRAATLNRWIMFTR